MSVFLKDRHYAAAREILRRAAREHDGHFCSMTVDEVAWVLLRRPGSPEVLREKVEFLFQTPFGFLAPTREVYLKAAELAERTRVPYGDCHIAAQAMVKRMDSLASFDRDFDRLPGIRRVEAL